LTQFSQPVRYWNWFLRGETPGWKKLFDRWALVHFAVGVVVANVVEMPIHEAAKTVLLPLAGILVGMSFAWVGSALAIVQSSEVERLASRSKAGFEGYVHPFQSAILVLLVCLVSWGLAGLGVLDRPCSWHCPSWGYTGAESTLYGFVSFAIRECWQVVLGAQDLLLYQRAIRRLPGQRDE
jgi:hypothetical protein